MEGATRSCETGKG